jgi:superfamily II RNA helicase
MDWTQIVTIGGITFAVQIVSAICSHMIMRRDNQELREQVVHQANELRQLKEERIAKVEQNVKAMQENCRKDVQKTQIDSLEGVLRQMQGDLRAIKDDVAGAREDIAAVKSDLNAKGIWMNNMDKSIQVHVTNHKIHAKG